VRGERVLGGAVTDGHFVGWVGWVGRGAWGWCMCGGGMRGGSTTACVGWVGVRTVLGAAVHMFRVGVQLRAKGVTLLTMHPQLYGRGTAFPQSVTYAPPPPAPLRPDPPTTPPPPSGQGCEEGVCAQPCCCGAQAEPVGRGGQAGHTSVGAGSWKHQGTLQVGRRLKAWGWGLGWLVSMLDTGSMKAICGRLVD